MEEARLWWLLGSVDGGLSCSAVELCRSLSLRLFGLLCPNVRVTVRLSAGVHDAVVLYPIVQPPGVLCSELQRLLGSGQRLCGVLRSAGIRPVLLPAESHDWPVWVFHRRELCRIMQPS